MQTLVAEILAAWRRAERLSASLDPGTPEREAVQRTSDRLRDAYRELTESGVAHGLTALEARNLIANLDVERDLPG